MRRARRSRGFTLMEVLLVLTILVVLGSLVGVSYVKMQQNANRNAAKAQVAMLEECINHYLLDIGVLPSEQDGLNALLNPPSDLADPTKWQGPYLDKSTLPKDPWQHDYIYHLLSTDKFQIISCGPDGVEGGTDDITTQL
jgi:general secretion pathway protein G